VFTCKNDKSAVEFRHLECDNITEATVQMQTVPFREVGPSFSMCLRRNKMANHDLFKEACRQPKILNPEKKKANKNKYTTALGETKGKVFLQHQDIETIALRKFKGMGKRGKKEEEQNGEAKLAAEDV